MLSVFEQHSEKNFGLGLDFSITKTIRMEFKSHHDVAINLI